MTNFEYGQPVSVLLGRGQQVVGQEDRSDRKLVYFNSLDEFNFMQLFYTFRTIIDYFPGNIGERALRDNLRDSSIVDIFHHIAGAT